MIAGRGSALELDRLFQRSVHGRDRRRVSCVQLELPAGLVEEHSTSVEDSATRPFGYPQQLGADGFVDDVHYY